MTQMALLCPQSRKMLYLSKKHSKRPEMEASGLKTLETNHFLTAWRKVSRSGWLNLTRLSRRTGQRQIRGATTMTMHWRAEQHSSWDRLLVPSTVQENYLEPFRETVIDIKPSLQTRAKRTSERVHLGRRTQLLKKEPKILHSKTAPAVTNLWFPQRLLMVREIQTKELQQAQWLT